MRKLWPLGLVILATTTCGPERLPEPEAASEDPVAAFSALESRLVLATAVRLDFHVTAVGVVEADLRGTLRLGPEDSVRLAATGRFAGEDVDLLLRSRGDALEVGEGPEPATVSRPPQLKEAILIGLTRMGILHNLARLTGGGLPDHADGGVREWVVVHPAADSTAPAAISLGLIVAGSPSGTASLELDADGFPVVRRQTVQFPAGEMQVVERYSGVTIEQ